MVTYISCPGHELFVYYSVRNISSHDQGCRYVVKCWIYFLFFIIWDRVLTTNMTSKFGNNLFLVTLAQMVYGLGQYKAQCEISQASPIF